MTAVFIVLGVLAALLVLLFAVCGVIFKQLVWQNPFPTPKWFAKFIAGAGAPDNYARDMEKARKALDAFPIETVWLHAPDGAKLCGHVLVPKKPNGKLVLACHGARSSGLGEFCQSAPFYYENGYTLVMPDHRGCGESDGKYMGYGTHESKDTFLWVNYSKARFPDCAIFLLGVSMGGATVLMMSNHADDPAIRGIVADCPYTSAWDEFSYQIHTSFHLPDFPVLHICDLYCRIFCGYRFRDASPLDAVRCAKKPVLFIHGEKDDYVPTFMQGTLYDACPTKKERLVVPGAVHARSYYTAPALYQKTITEFMEQYAGEKV